MQVTMELDRLTIIYDIPYDPSKGFSEKEMMASVIKRFGQVIGENKIIWELATPEQILRLGELLE